MNNKNVLSVCEFVKGVKKATLGIELISVTIPDMVGGKKNPYKDRVVKITKLRNVGLGFGYENVVAKKADTKDFTSEKPKGKYWVDFPYILAADKDSEKKYLRCYVRNSMRSNPIFLVDGRLATENEKSEILERLRKRTPSKKQEDLGIAEEEQCKPFDFLLTHIVSIKQGEKSYQNPLYCIKDFETLFED